MTAPIPFLRLPLYRNTRSGHASYIAFVAANWNLDHTKRGQIYFYPALLHARFLRWKLIRRARRVDLLVGDQCAVQIRLTKVRPMCISVAQIGIAQIRADKASIQQMSLAQVGSPQMGLHQISPAEIRALQVSSGQLCPIQVRSHEARPAQIRALQVSPAEICIAQICIAQFAFVQVRLYSWIRLPPCIPAIRTLFQKVELLCIYHKHIPPLYYC